MPSHSLSFNQHLVILSLLLPALVIRIFQRRSGGDICCHQHYHKSSGASLSHHSHHAMFACCGGQCDLVCYCHFPMSTSPFSLATPNTLSSLLCLCCDCPVSQSSLWAPICHGSSLFLSWSLSFQCLFILALPCHHLPFQSALPYSPLWCPLTTSMSLLLVNQCLVILSLFMTSLCVVIVRISPCNFGTGYFHVHLCHYSPDVSSSSLCPCHHCLLSLSTMPHICHWHLCCDICLLFCLPNISLSYLHLCHHCLPSLSVSCHTSLAFVIVFSSSAFSSFNHP